MDNSPNTPRAQDCRCGAIDKLARNENYPIDFDEKYNEYNILSNDQNHAIILRYCFLCGGKLPDSTRRNEFVQWDDNELHEVSEGLKSLLTIEDFVRHLGQPDQVYHGPIGVSKNWPDPAPVREIMAFEKYKGKYDIFVYLDDDGKPKYVLAPSKL